VVRLERALHGAGRFLVREPAALSPQHGAPVLALHRGPGPAASQCVAISARARRVVCMEALEGLRYAPVDREHRAEIGIDDLAEETARRRIASVPARKHASHNAAASA